MMPVAASVSGVPGCRLRPVSMSPVPPVDLPNWLVAGPAVPGTMNVVPAALTEPGPARRSDGPEKLAIPAARVKMSISATRRRSRYGPVKIGCGGVARRGIAALLLAPGWLPWLPPLLPLQHERPALCAC